MSIREVELIWLWRVLLPSLLLFYCACVISVFIDTTGVIDTPHGVARIVQLGLEGHLAAGALVACQVVIGANLLRAIGGARPSIAGLDGFLFSLVVGFWVIDVMAFGLALVGRLEAMWIVVALIALLAATGWAASKHPGIDWGERIPSGERSPSLVVLAGFAALIACVAWLWPLLVQTALPNSDWDSALYHLPLAERYLAGEVWNRDPLFSAHSFPGGVSLIYAIFLAFDLEHAIVPLNFLYVVFALVAVYALGRRLAGTWGGAWSLLVCAGLHALWQQAVDPRVDGFLSFFVVVAVIALASRLMDRSNATLAVVLGAALGVGIGAKYTGLFIAGGFAAVWLVGDFLERDRGAAHACVRGYAISLLFVVLPHGAWYVSNVALHGDPLFPMLRGDYYTDDARPGERIAMSGALDRFLSETSPEVDAKTKRLEQTRGASVPSNLFDLPALFLHPERYATKPNHFVSPLLLLCLALPFALPRDHARKTAALATACIGWACFVGIASQTNLVRYSLPFLALLAAICGLVLARLTHPLWRAAWLVLGLAVLLPNHQAEGAKLERLKPDYFAQVEGDRLRWLERVGYNFTPAMPKAVRRINEAIESGDVPRNSRILLLGEGKGRLLDCESVPDLSWFLQRFAVEIVRAELDSERVLESLDRQGITHVLYNPGYFRWVAGHTSFSKRQIAFTMVQVDRFLARHGTLLFEVAGMKLVRLDDDR